MNYSNLNIIFWNSRSIRNKIVELTHFIVSNHVDICCLSETWLNESDGFNIPNYKYVRKDRVGQAGGGVAIIIKNNIEFKIVQSIPTQIIENTGIELKLNDSQSIKLYSIYFPGGVNSSTLRSLFKSDLRKILNTDGNYIFCGDLCGIFIKMFPLP